ncbi:phosphoribosylanthranilate isomerase [Bacteroides sp. 519]|uniref:phosphoribosylanthranilate isomerase n=1 Tax=Bacteroides sp. 519 TaxID=2302937 RepID=UPI0013D38583|nr:phosphoribosylanthranilate isomerase [Bacteroides sp. 519]NDV59554.1 phosphoribosylanthranilate isomerase [Bacteroides sp. 519]
MTNNKILKVCGMQDADNIRAVEDLGVDWLGFIFYPKSPRYLAEIPQYLPNRAKRVGVFVNESRESICITVDRFSLNYVQLHGNESPEFCNNIQKEGIKVIKAFSLKHANDLSITGNYEDICNYFLFDTKCKQHGGSGNQFDWEILKNYKGKTPFLLSGGINEYSANSLNQLKHPQLVGYDINSRFETIPGFKDVERIRKFHTALLKNS